MINSSESFRQELASRLAAVLPQDQLTDALAAFDLTSAGYTITEKETALATVPGIPEVVKFFIASKAVENCSMGTLNQYRYKLLNFFSAVRKSYADITANDVRVYLYDLKQARPVSDSYLDNIRRTLSSFFDWLRRNDYLQKNPMEKVAKIKYQPAIRQPLTSYDVEVLRWVCHDLRDKAIVDMLYTTGCRVSELVALDQADIDWHDRSARIRHGKGDKYRIVFFNAEAELSLRKYLESRTDDNPALFVQERGPHNRLSIRAVQLRFKAIRSRCQLSSKAFPHNMRHTFATASLRSGMPLVDLQMLMGHAKPETTMIYAKVDNADLQRAHLRAFG